MKMFICSAVFAAVLNACASVPSRRIAVVDERGFPIQGVGTVPLAMSLRLQHESDKNGRLTVYGPSRLFGIGAPGHLNREFAFKDPRSIFVLERASETQRRASERASSLYLHSPRP